MNSVLLLICIFLGWNIGKIMAYLIIELQDWYEDHKWIYYEIKTNEIEESPNYRWSAEVPIILSKGGKTHYFSNVIKLIKRNKFFKYSKPIHYDNKLIPIENSEHNSKFYQEMIKRNGLLDTLKILGYKGSILTN